jgi:hypothetical protein
MQLSYMFDQKKKGVTYLIEELIMPGIECIKASLNIDIIN